MNVNVAVLIGQLLIFGLGAAVLIWDRQRDKNKSAVDAATATNTTIDTERLQRTVEDMSRKSNAWRDTWLFQLQDYLNLDSGWHLNMMANERLMITLIKELITVIESLGGDISHIVIPSESPAPPPIPLPPPVT